MTTPQKLFTIALLTILISNPTKAQPKTGEFINAAVGLGLSAATYEKQDIGGKGFYAQAEYVHATSDWFGIRPYMGVVITSPNKNEKPETQPDYTATTKALLLGGKVRICAPIPYVAPYLEIGLGLSIGSFETYTPDEHFKKSGVIPHIPFALGVALGRKHLIEIAFTYCFQPSISQFSGAAALGLSFPLKNND